MQNILLQRCASPVVCAMLATRFTKRPKPCNGFLDEHLHLLRWLLKTGASAPDSAVARDPVVQPVLHWSHMVRGRVLLAQLQSGVVQAAPVELLLARPQACNMLDQAASGQERHPRMWSSTDKRSLALLCPPRQGIRSNGQLRSCRTGCAANVSWQPCRLQQTVKLLSGGI